jgi:hypothetical protein
VIERKKKRVEESELRKKEKESLRKQKEIMLMKNNEKKNEMGIGDGNVNFDSIHFKYIHPYTKNSPNQAFVFVIVFQGFFRRLHIKVYSTP